MAWAVELQGTMQLPVSDKERGLVISLRYTALRLQQHGAAGVDASCNCSDTRCCRNLPRSTPPPRLLLSMAARTTSACLWSACAA
jgi:hypothetical protein